MSVIRSLPWNSALVQLSNLTWINMWWPMWWHNVVQVIQTLTNFDQLWPTLTNFDFLKFLNDWWIPVDSHKSGAKISAGCQKIGMRSKQIQEMQGMLWKCPCNLIAVVVERVIGFGPACQDSEACSRYPRERTSQGSHCYWKGHSVLSMQWFWDALSISTVEPCWTAC